MILALHLLGLRRRTAVDVLAVVHLVHEAEAARAAADEAAREPTRDAHRAREGTRVGEAEAARARALDDGALREAAEDLHTRGTAAQGGYRGGVELSAAQRGSRENGAHLALPADAALLGAGAALVC